MMPLYSSNIRTIGEVEVQPFAKFGVSTHYGAEFTHICISAFFFFDHRKDTVKILRMDTLIFAAGPAYVFGVVSPLDCNILGRRVFKWIKHTEVCSSQFNSN